MTDRSAPPRITLAPGLEISRVLTGLWQIADMERDGASLNADRAAAALADYASAGFDTFDMADHYGSAELIAGRLLAKARAGDVATVSGKPPVCMTKWCPQPAPMDRQTVEAGIRERAERLGVEAIDLLQCHWFFFEHLAWIDAFKHLRDLRDDGLIRHLGVTNFDTDHLRVLIAQNIPIVSNQVSCSLLDRRALGDMSTFCLENGIKILAYGTLLGGFLSDRWVGAAEPADIADWSKMKYKRFIDTAGGWDKFQAVLQALASVAKRHAVSVSNVATRWVLDQPVVAGIIVGARLGESEHRDANAQLFSFDLDNTDRQQIDEALADLDPIPGDCGDEYRRPPFLTASGDMSHHISDLPTLFSAQPATGGASRVDTGSVWEDICGYSRAVRIGDRVLVSGTTATHTDGSNVALGDAGAQAVYILDKILASLAPLGASRDDVVRTRVYLQNADDWEPVSRVHGHYFAKARPANTLLEISRLVGDYTVEIEAEAVVRPTD